MSACKTQPKNTDAFPYQNLIGVWKLESIKTAERTVTGDDMGKPTYEFTQDGKRIKRLPPAPEEVVAYTRNATEITYPGTKLPNVTITALDATHLVLKSSTAEWSLTK